MSLIPTGPEGDDDREPTAEDVATALGQLANQVDARFEASNARFSAIDRRFAALIRRVDEIEEGIPSLVERFDSRFRSLDSRCDATDARVDHVHENVTLRIAGTERRVQTIVSLAIIAAAVGWAGAILSWAVMR